MAFDAFMEVKLLTQLLYSRKLRSIAAFRESFIRAFLCGGGPGEHLGGGNPTRAQGRSSCGVTRVRIDTGV